MTIKIKLNGEDLQIAKTSNLHDLITSLQLQDQALAVAVNRLVISKQKWTEKNLKANDSVDIVRAIGGG